MRVVLASLVVALVVTASAVAARPSSTTITGPLDPITLEATSPSLGDSVLFKVSTNDPFPWIQVQCFQAGTLVYSEHHGALPGIYGYDLPFQLGPTLRWQSGAADCTASVRSTKRGALDKVLASVSFTTAA